MTTLEENSGDGGNSSINELEERVETLETTAADHETRLTVNEENIQGKNKRWLYPCGVNRIENIKILV